MKRLLCTLFLVVPLVASATEWYVALEATAGNTNGLSWANAWTNVTQIKWSSVQAGDTIWISGGATGGTNQYVGFLSTASQSANHGTSGNRIAIRTAKDSPRNGRVKIMGGIYIDKNYYTIDGSVNSNWVPTTVLDTYRIYTNINLEVCKTNNGDGNHGINYGSCLGQRLYWVNVSAAGTEAAGGGADVNALQLNGNSGGSFVNECEIAYNVLAGAWGYGFFALGMATNTFGQIDFHHNIIEAVHDNYIEADGGLDIHDNVMRGWVSPTVGHPDAIQGITISTRIWNNVIQDQSGTAVYIEPVGMDLVHDIYVYNNFFNTTTQAWHDGFTLTGAALTNTWSASNIWVFNNTIVDYVGSSVWVWNSGASATNVVGGGPLVNLATNIHWLNNTIILSNIDSTSVLLFLTNLDHKNDARGMAYSTTPSGVEVNYNNIHGSILSASQGLKYGSHGDYYDAGFTNFSDFSLTYAGYSSNNNTTATFVSPDNFDFRPGADSALKMRGTNLTSLTNLCPNADKDILGNSRGTVWDIGAYQSDPTLKLWFTFDNWAGATNVIDDSGYGHTAYIEGTVTNWPTLTNGPSGFGNAASWTGFTTNWWDAQYPEPPGSLKYFAITNITGIEYLTNATISFWAWWGTNTVNNSMLLCAAYATVEYSWRFSYDSYNNTHFVYVTNGTETILCGFPDSLGDPGTVGYGWTNWAHYAVTWDGTNAIDYFNGVSVGTNALGIPYLRVATQPTGDHWLALGTNPHEGTPQYGDETPASAKQPNAFWFGGRMDDVRIYDRALSASEITSIIAGGGTSSSSPAAPEPPPASTNQTAQISGYLKLDGQFQLK